MLHPAPQRRFAPRAPPVPCEPLLGWRGPCTCTDHLIDRIPALITLSWLVLIALVGGILAVVDGVLRLRGKGGTAVGLFELIAGLLFLISLFVPIAWGSIVLAVVTAVALIVALVVRGKSAVALTIVALILVVAWIVLANRWIVIPGIN